MLAILLALAASVQTADNVFTDQAAQCGLKPSQMKLSTDQTGRRHAILTPNGDIDSLPFAAIKCMADWAQATGNAVGFISEPPSGNINSLPSGTEAKQAIIQCGVDTQKVTAAFERELQEDVIWIDGRTQFSDHMLACVARASMKTLHYVYFRNQVTNARYQKTYWRLSTVADVENARLWLSNRGLLSKLPVPQPSELAPEYAAQLETFCGLDRGALLVAFNEHTITFDPEKLGKRTATDDQVLCIINAGAAADLPSHDLFFGFIGNAAYSEKGK